MFDADDQWADAISHSGDGRIVHIRRATPVAAAAIIISVGSACEDRSTNGLVHLLEHLFLRSHDANSPDLSAVLESEGIELNAETNRERLLIWVRCQRQQFPSALRRLVARLYEFTFDDETIRQERAVVLDELRSAFSDPSDLIHDLFYSGLFDGTTYALPVGGIPATVERLDSHVLRDVASRLHREWSVGYVTLSQDDESPLVGLLESGGLAHGEVLAPTERGALSRAFRLRPILSSGSTGEDAKPSTPACEWGPADLLAARISRENSAAYVAIGGPAPSFGDPRRWTFQLFVSLFGGTSFSDLWSALRSHGGYSYDVMGVQVPLSHAGSWRVMASCSPDDSFNVAEEMRACLQRRVEVGWDSVDLARARKASFNSQIFERESSAEYVIEAAISEFSGGVPLLTPTELHSRLAEVTVDEVNHVAEEVLDSLVVVGTHL